MRGGYLGSMGRICCNKLLALLLVLVSSPLLPTPTLTGGPLAHTTPKSGVLQPPQHHRHRGTKLQRLSILRVKGWETKSQERDGASKQSTLRSA